MSTRNRLDLETLEPRPIMLKNLCGHLSKSPHNKEGKPKSFPPFSIVPPTNVAFHVFVVHLKPLSGHKQICSNKYHERRDGAHTLRAQPLHLISSHLIQPLSWRL